MSGAFNYPRPEHYLAINYNDEVIVDWWSTFANQLQVNCAEGASAPQTYNYTFDSLNQNGTQRWSPIQLSRTFSDWSLPASCEFAIYEKNFGGITGAKIGVTSAATQSASILGLSSTVAYDSVTTSSATSSPSASSTPSSSTSSAPPTFIPTSTPISNKDSSSGLSTGAKAGIGAGIGVGALLVAAAAYLFYRSQRKMKDLNARFSEYSEAQEYGKPVGVAVAHYESPGYDTPYRGATTRSEGHGLVETSPQELPDTR